MSEKEKQTDPQVASDPKVSDEALADVNGGWGPQSSRFFDSFRNAPGRQSGKPLAAPTDGAPGTKK